MIRPGNMTRPVIVALLGSVVVLFVSCKTHSARSHEQRSSLGRFAANGGGGLCSFVSPAGGWPASVSVLWGYALTPEGYVAADTERVNLMYIVSGYPEANCTHSTGSNEEFTASWSHTWEARGKSYTMSLSWDNRTEVVTAAGQQFVRTNGNVFVFSVETNGEVSCRQLPSLGPAADCAEVLRHVQRHCADNRFLSSLLLENREGP